MGAAQPLRLSGLLAIGDTNSLPRLKSTVKPDLTDLGFLFGAVNKGNLALPHIPQILGRIFVQKPKWCRIS